MRGRSRTIKPEIFDDEALADLELKTGLPLFRVFAGLWCFADREGRFEWSPRALRGSIHPCWDGDMAAALEALASHSYIIRYTVRGRDYGHIRNFKKHQSIHKNETPSTLPAPSEHGPEVPGNYGESPVKGLQAGSELTRTSTSTSASTFTSTKASERDRAREAVPEVPGLDRVMGNGVARTYTMPSESPSQEYLDQASTAGVSREQATSTWSHYVGAGLPDRGVERLNHWLVQRAKERANATTKVASKHASAQPNAGKTGWE